MNSTGSPSTLHLGPNLFGHVSYSKRRITKLLPAQGQFTHQTALGDGKHRHPLAITTMGGGRIVAPAAGARRHAAAGMGFCRGTRGNDHAGRLGAEFIFAGGKVLEALFFLERFSRAVGMDAREVSI